LEVAENYIQFAEPDTDLAIKASIIDTLRVDTDSDQIRNVKGLVTLSPNEASFMDTWWSLYPAIDTVMANFMTVDTSQ